MYTSIHIHVCMYTYAATASLQSESSLAVSRVTPLETRSETKFEEGVLS